MAPDRVFGQDGFPELAARDLAKLNELAGIVGRSLDEEGRGVAWALIVDLRVLEGRASRADPAQLSTLLSAAARMTARRVSKLSPRRPTNPLEVVVEAMLVDLAQNDGSGSDLEIGGESPDAWCAGRVVELQELFLT